MYLVTLIDTMIIADMIEETGLYVIVANAEKEETIAIITVIVVIVVAVDVENMYVDVERYNILEEPFIRALF